ncbi:MAG TPA: MFS transporter [Dissulfurispiraceae bacterium]|nr:MFS transporter [Dissulfurispiraceae bacterium]
MMTPFRFLCITGVFAIFSSTISKSPVLPLFAAYLGADPSEVGMVAAVSAFTGIVASIPAGFIADHCGRRKMLVGAAVVFATAPFLYLAVTQIWQLAIVRLYHGIATAIFLPVGMALVSELFHRERGEKLGWFSTAMLLGRFCAPIAGGTLLSLMMLSEAHRFHAVYLVCGAAGLTTLLLALRIPKEEACRLPSRSLRTSWSAFKTVVASKAIVLTCTVEAGILFAYGIFETFVPLYAIQSGISAVEIGVLLSVQVITLAISKPAMGRFSDRHGRQPQIFWGAVLGAACIALFSVVVSFPGLLVLSILLGLSLSILTSASSAYIADLSSAEARGAAMGILGSIMDIGQTAGPLIAGFVILQYGFGPAFLVAAVVLAAAASAFLAHAGRAAFTGFRFRS